MNFQSANMAVVGGAKIFGASSRCILRPCVLIFSGVTYNISVMAVTRSGVSPKSGVTIRVPNPMTIRRFVGAADDRVLELNEAFEGWMVQLKINRTLYKSPHGGIVTGECVFQKY